MDIAIINRVEESIVGDTGDFFQRPILRENLHVTLRITSDFHDFLRLHGPKPSSSEIDYAMRTVISGLEWFMGLADICASHDYSEQFRAYESTIGSFAELLKRFL